MRTAKELLLDLVEAINEEEASEREFVMKETAESERRFLDSGERWTLILDEARAWLENGGRQ